MKICVIAGEPSGDFLGGKLIEALKRQQPAIEFSGVGGPQMMAAGQPSIFPYEELAVMGVAEIAPKIISLMSRIRQTIEHIKETKPDVVVTIDSPDFCFRVAKAVKREMQNPPKIIHYVAPTVWAWREGRADKIAAFLDGLICLFDFEPAYFKFPSIAAGHPMVEGDALSASRKDFREDHGIPLDDTVIGVLFGSRRGEIKRCGEIIRDAVFKIAEKMPIKPHILAPTLPHLRDQVYELLRPFEGEVHVITDHKQKWGAFKSMDIAVAVSGTVGLELSMLQVPHIIAYKANIITYHLIRNLVKVKYAHLANIMAGRAIVPEYLQDLCDAEKIADGAWKIFKDPKPQTNEFADIAKRLGAGQAQTPSEKAAAFVLTFCS